MDVRWIHGSESAKHNADPDIQIYRYDERTVILRQNMAVNCEAPFMFLLFGDDRALLIDAGATKEPEFFPLRQVVDSLISDFRLGNPRADYRLLILHTHSHYDHVAADVQFADRLDTTIIGAGMAEAWPYFGFDSAPDRVALTTIPNHPGRYVFADFIVVLEE
jgi:glyoxylase-like metal-dependent hydrolase (beta-lactamase superfamily II)